MSSSSDEFKQLVVELYVRDFKASCTFYRAYGFRMVRDEDDFAVLQWEDTLLFLEANPMHSFLRLSQLAIYVFWFQMSMITGHYPSRWGYR